jgi:hypothetical protein
VQPLQATVKQVLPNSGVRGQQVRLHALPFHSHGVQTSPVPIVSCSWTIPPPAPTVNPTGR